jgi:uncharacterized protein (TIGR02246 family)
MRNPESLLYTAFLVLMAMAGGALAQTASQNRQLPVSSKVPAGIEQLHHDDVVATLRGDAEALTALWDQDGVLLQLGYSPVIGKTALREFLNQNLAKSTSPKVLKYAPEIRDVRVGGEMAYEWGFFEATVKSSDQEQPRNFSARFVRILRRQPDGSWKFSLVMWAAE